MQTYDKAVIPVLVSTLADLLQHQPSLQILIAATIRNEQTFEAFDVACRTSSLHQPPTANRIGSTPGR